MNWFPAKPSPGGLPFGRLHSLLAVDPSWQQEPKFDGWRVVVTVLAGEVCIRTRKGLAVDIYDARIKAALLELGPCQLDGELLKRSTLWVFDAPTIPGSLSDRRAALERMPMREPVRLVPLLEGLAGFDEALRMGAEGVVLKDRRQQYPRSHRVGGVTAHWWKVKQ